MDSHTVAQHGKEVLCLTHAEFHTGSSSSRQTQADVEFLNWSLCFFLETGNVNKQLEPNIVLTDRTL